jgi:hypothetical protein
MFVLKKNQKKASFDSMKKGLWLLGYFAALRAFFEVSQRYIEN